MAGEDLSEFRKNWLKELKKQKEKSGKAQKPGTSADYQSESVSSSSGIVTVHHQHDNVADSLQTSPSDPEDVTIGQPQQNTDADNQNKESQHHSFAPSPEGNQERELFGDSFDGNPDASATYYPFRILTTLLNHASSDEGPKQRRKRSSGVVNQEEGTSSTVTPKRAYFSSSSLDGKKDLVMLKKAKKEDEETSEHDKTKAKSMDYLDLFIADLNEISEIPFFDVTLPREVAIKIFWYLGIKDLCRCAQVSKSWRSLAEDELLWCRLCHQLGFESDTLTVQHSNWKSRVRQYIVIRHTLELNWKGRIGKLHNLHYAKGGVLCAAHAHGNTIVAGYSNCQTKLWGVLSGETCVFQPSSTALLIDEDEEEGTISNEVLHVATCHKVTAASYSHCFVDVWSNDEAGTEPVYTFTCQGRGPFQQPSSLQLWENSHTVYLAAATGRDVQVHTLRQGETGGLKDNLTFDSIVKRTKWIQDSTTTTSPTSLLTPMLTIATNNIVSVAAFYERDISSLASYEIFELHNIVEAPVTCVDSRLQPEQVVVAFTLNTGPTQYFRVDVYDLLTKKVSASLAGHTASVLCVNAQDSPQHHLVTGSQDRKVRVYDTRSSHSALMTLMGHSAAVTTVQMDDWKVVSGDEAGFVRLWDQRMARKLWEMNNRHPVRYCHFEDRQLTICHVPYIKHQYSEFDFDTGLHQRHRGSLHVYDFLADQMTQGVPEICLSTFDEPQGYNYNIGLAMPYDQV